MFFTDRVQDVRDELHEAGYSAMWQTTSRKGTDEPVKPRIITLFLNGAGKVALLVEHADGSGWDLLRPFTSSNKQADTFIALAEYTKGE